MRVRLGRRAVTRRGLSLVLGVACASADLAHAAPPDPSESPEPPDTQEPQTAAQWYARGYELGVAGDYEAAAAAFLRSYELQPTSEALFNVALAHEQAGATIDAILYYERFLAEPAPPPDLVEAAHLSIDSLLTKVAVLEGLRYAPEQPPTELYVNGERVEIDGFPRLVLPGEIEVEVVAKSGERAHESYDLAAGETLIVDLRGLLPTPEPPPPDIVVDDGPNPAELEADRARARARRTAKLRKLTWVGIGVTGASVIGASTLGLLAQRERKLYEQFTCFEFVGQVCPPDFAIEDADAHRRAYGRYVWSGTIVAGVSGGFAIATLVIGLVAVRSARPRAGSSKVAWVPMPGGIGLRF
jgi:tetratricopeptide (TPR) repeat protein